MDTYQIFNIQNSKNILLLQFFAKLNLWCVENKGISKIMKEITFIFLLFTYLAFQNLNINTRVGYESCSRLIKKTPVRKPSDLGRRTENFARVSSHAEQKFAGGYP